MSRFVMPVDVIHVTYAGDHSAYRARRMTRAQFEAFSIAYNAALRVEDKADRGTARSEVALDALSTHVEEVSGPGGDQYPADHAGRREWWRELRSAVETFAIVGKLTEAVIGDPTLLSFGRAAGESQSPRND